MPLYAADAYSAVEKTTATGRQLEAGALFRVARTLQLAQEQWGTPGGETKLDDAVRLNQKLWTFFQAELAEPDNPLPRELKLSLVRLIDFIDRRTFDVMAFPDPAKLTVLININRNIAAGLSTSSNPAPATV